METDGRRAGGDDAVIHWNRSASVWDVVGPPLRPCAEDLAIMEREVAGWALSRPGGRTRALLLGVTPEIACMAWPAATELIACDESDEMIRHVWPGDVPGRRHAQRADWLRLPVADGAMDIVIGDGSFSCVDMDFPAGHEHLARSIHRVISSDGLLVVRIYAQQEPSEDPRRVFDDLVAGRFGTFDAFRLALLMAMQGESPSVVLDDVYQAWSRAAIDFDAVAEGNRWRPEVVNSVLRYRGKRARYSFPTVGQVRSTLSPWFDEVSAHRPRYQLGDRCPVLVLRPRWAQAQPGAPTRNDA